MRFDKLRESGDGGFYRAQGTVPELARAEPPQRVGSRLGERERHPYLNGETRSDNG